jgi:hypothetical protein
LVCSFHHSFFLLSDRDSKPCQSESRLPCMKVDWGARSSYILQDGSLVVLCVSAHSGTHTNVYLREDQIAGFDFWKDGFISLDNAIPDLSPKDQELLLTGVLPEEMESFYGRDDENG